MTRTARRLLALALASALATPAAAQNFQAFRAADIRVDGLQRISSGTVFTYLPVERGDTIDQATAGEAIRALFRTGFFNDVTLERQGDILVVKVVERPAINQVTLVGTKDIKTEELTRGLAGIGLAEGETFSRLSLDRVTQELTRQYNNRGKYNVTITPQVTELDRNRVDVTLNIVEGKAARIRHVNLTGNETFTDEEILEAWESRESNWLSWYRRDDQYSREKLSGDLEKLSSFYLDRGYVDFTVDSSQVSISADRRDMYISANVNEGEIYTLGAIRVTGDTIIPLEEAEKLVMVREGQVFSRRMLEYTSDAITAVLGNIGYAFAEVTPVPELDRENRTVAINFFVEPGPRVQVRRISFTGNTRTADEVLRREMRQFEGAWFSQAAIDRSKIRLQRLGFFETVEVTTPAVPGSEDMVDVVYDVKETNSGQFQFGLGYSQLSGLITSVQLQENNFLGSGSRVGVTVQDNDYSSSYAFSYVDPYFTDDGVSLGYNLFFREFDQSDFNIANYSSTSAAGQVVLGIPLTETDSISVAFGLDSNEILTFRGFTPDEAIDYIDTIGNRTFKSWRTELAWARDSRNDFFAPTRGTYQRLGAELTLPGSTAEYYKIEYEFSRYWPIARWLVLRTGAEIGYGDAYGEWADLGLPFFENFYAGGTRSIRGYRDNTLGPQAGVFVNTDPNDPLSPKVETNLQPIGGAVKTVGQLEFVFPTVFDSPAARLSAFVDFGNVYDSWDTWEMREFRYSAGVALQWRAPIGPIVISYAVPFNTDRNDRTERLQFTFGTTF